MTDPYDAPAEPGPRPRSQGRWAIGVALAGVVVVAGAAMLLGFALGAVCVVSALTALGTQLNAEYGEMAEQLEQP